MFRKMKKENMKMTERENMKLLEEGEYIVVSTIGEDGYPYGFPMSYILMDGHVYFHCALYGHKADNIAYNNKVSFSLVDETRLRPEIQDTDFKSLIGFGKASLVDGKEKARALKKTVDKYAGGYEKEGYADIGPEFDIVSVYKIEIERLTGKERKDGQR